MNNQNTALENNKNNSKVCNILQLCVSIWMVVHLLLVGVLIGIPFWPAMALISTLHIPFITINMLAAFGVSPFKKRSLKLKIIQSSLKLFFVIIILGLFCLGAFMELAFGPRLPIISSAIAPHFILALFSITIALNCILCAFEIYSLKKTKNKGINENEKN